MKRLMLLGMLMALVAGVSFAAGDAVKGGVAPEGNLQKNANKPVKDMVDVKKQDTEKQTATWTNPNGKEITNHGMYMKLQNQEKREAKKAAKNDSGQEAQPGIQPQPVIQPQPEAQAQPEIAPQASQPEVQNPAEQKGQGKKQKQDAEKQTATWTNPSGKQITNHGMYMKLQNQEKREAKKAAKNDSGQEQEVQPPTQPEGQPEVQTPDQPAVQDPVEDIQKQDDFIK